MARDDGWRPSADTRIGICPEWHLRIKCGLCDRTAEYLVRDVGDVYGCHRTIAEIVARLRFGTCHRPSVEVQLTLTDPDGSTKAVRLPIQAKFLACLDRRPNSHAPVRGQSWG